MRQNVKITKNNQNFGQAKTILESTITFEYAIALTNRWSASTTDDIAFSRNSPYMLRILGCLGHSASACRYSLEARSALLLLAAACTDFMASASHSDHADERSTSWDRCSSSSVVARRSGF